MRATPHNHPLNGKLHDRCPACDLIRDRHKRDAAVREVEADLEGIHNKAQLRYPKQGKRKQ